MPGSSNPEDLVKYYATFGGTPYYLEQLNGSLSFEENVEALFFDMSGLLYEEPLMLLRQELREPALYNSVLESVGCGARKLKSISERSGVEPNSVGKYLRTLENLGLLERIVPFGSNPVHSKKSRYRIKDPLFAFCYRFVSSNIGAIESGAGHAVCQAELQDQAVSAYVGLAFERICLQWLARENAQERLPFLATSFGSWWGTDPAAQEECDIDVIAASKQESTALFGECKWRNSFNETNAFGKLSRRAQLVGTFDRRFHRVFSKVAPSEGTSLKTADDPSLAFVTLDDLFADR